MSRADIGRHRRVLERSVVFKGVESVALDRIVERSVALSARAGDVLIREDRRGGSGLYVLIEGQVEIFRAKDPAHPRASNKTHIASLEPGHCFGEYSLIDGKKTSASVRALTAVKLFFLPRGEFLRITESDPQTGRIVYRNLLAFMIERLRELGILVGR